MTDPPRPNRLRIPSNSYDDLKLYSPLSPLTPNPFNSSPKKDTMAHFYEAENKEIISYSDLKTQLKLRFAKQMRDQLSQQNKEINVDNVTQEMDNIWHNLPVELGTYSRIMGCVTRTLSSSKNKPCPICDKN